MKNNIIPKFDDVNRALEILSSSASISESHGLLCALLSKKAEISLNAWLHSLTTNNVDLKNIDIDKSYAILKKLYAGTKKQLDLGDFSLELLLPSDNELFHERLSAMVSWVEGYISGLGLFNIKLENLTNQAIEGIHDLVEISKLDVNQDNANEVDESSYIELVEFIKIIVLLIHDEYSQHEKI